MMPPDNPASGKTPRLSSVWQGALSQQETRLSVRTKRVVKVARRPKLELSTDY